LPQRRKKKIYGKKNRLVGSGIREAGMKFPNDKGPRHMIGCRKEKYETVLTSEEKKDVDGS